MFFLYLVDLLRIEGHGSLDDRYNVIVDIIKMLKYAESIVNKTTEYDIGLSEIGKICRNLNSKYSYKICLFCNFLPKTINNVKKDPTQNKDMLEYLKVTIKNCKIMLRAITELQNQIRNSGLIQTKQIYSIESDTLNKTF